MKTIQRCFLLCSLGMICLLSDCSKSSDPAAIPGGSSSSSINGTATTFTTSKATDTGAGVEIVLADNTRKITMNLNDKTANTYHVLNTSSGRSAASTDATITVVIDNVIYYGVSGSVVATIGADGKLSGNFDIVLKSSTGQTLTISGGKINGIDIGAVPAGCKISSITYSASTSINCDGENSYSFFYNGDGKIARIVAANGIPAYYSYNVSGKLAAISTIYSANQSYSIEFTYNGTTLTSYKEKSTNGTVVSTDNYVIAYNGTTVTGITSTYSSTGSTSYTDTYSITYNVNEVARIIDSYNGGQFTYDLSNYDTKKNPFQLLAQLSGTPISFFYGGPEDKFRFFCLSTNNPTLYTSYTVGSTRTDAISYTYNAQNYPTNIRYAYSAPYTSCVQNFAIVYSGCQ